MSRNTKQTRKQLSLARKHVRAALEILHRIELYPDSQLRGETASLAKDQAYVLLEELGEVIKGPKPYWPRW